MRRICVQIVQHGMGMTYVECMEPDDSPVDVLTSVLQSVRLRLEFSSRVLAHEPWAATMPPFGDCLTFHLVLSGRCRVEVGEEIATAGPGELLLVPHGRGHHLASDAGIPSAGRVDALPQVYRSPTYSEMEFPGEGADTRLLCGVAAADGPVTARLLRSLPSIIHVDQRSPSATTQLRLALDLLAHEVESTRPGTAALTPVLADVTVMLALRWWVEHGVGGERGWLRALADPDIGPVLRAIHDAPGQEWSVARLAALAGMSRSAFAGRFRDLTGDGPMSYVSSWRMQVARDRLRDDRAATIAQVAHSLGYTSEAAFSRAFRKEMGMPPRAARTA